MNVGELFINLGVKGNDKTLYALGYVKGSLKETSSSALEVKAGIIAAMYALEQLMSASANTGTKLTNLNALFGFNIKTMQQYEYAARLAGASNEELTNSFVGIQKMMTNIRLNKGAPEGLQMVLRGTGKTMKDIKPMGEHPEQFFQLLAQYMKTEKDIGKRNFVADTFHLSNNIQAGMVRGGFNQNILDSAPTYTDKEVGKLDKIRQDWEKIETMIEMGIGKLTAQFGDKFLPQIADLVKQFFDLARVILELADSLKVFKLIAMSLKGWAEILGIGTAVIKASDASKSINDLDKNKTVQKRVKEEEFTPSNVLGDLLRDFLKTPAKAGESPGGANSAVPVIPANAGQTNNHHAQEIHVNQNINFAHNGQDTQRMTRDLKTTVQDAYRQISSQLQVS